jgi:bacterioferritin-associated ferredoxin
MTPFKVTKCVCKKISFEEIKQYCDEHGISEIEPLREQEICSTNCRMCDPYIRVMFETGETEFTPGAYLKNRAG